MISCSVLIAGIVRNALGSRGIPQYSCQLIGNFKIGVRIQMTVGSQSRLYFFMPIFQLIIKIYKLLCRIFQENGSEGLFII